MKYIKVDWLDAAASPGYYKQDKIGIMHCSVGHEIRNDKDGVVVGITRVMDGSNDIRMYVEIPRAYVKKVTRLR